MTASDDEVTRALLDSAAQEAIGSAARALGQMVGRSLRGHGKVLSAAPGVPPPPRSDEVTILFHVNELAGALFLVSWPRETLAAVREMLAPGTDETSVPDAMVAHEVANICTSHFLNTLGDRIGRSLLPSPPVDGGQENGSLEGFLIDVEFAAEEGAAFGGRFHFAPGTQLVEDLRSLARVPSGSRIQEEEVRPVEAHNGSA